MILSNVLSKQISYANAGHLQSLSFFLYITWTNEMVDLVLQSKL